MKIYLVRHGVTEWNLKGRYQGSSDIPLSDKGKKQANLLKPIFANIETNKIFTSPLLRAKETAEIVFANSNVTILDDLREYYFGEWEGLTVPEIKEKDQKLYEKFVNYDETFCFPDGESDREFNHRLVNVWNRLTESGDGCVVAVSHGAVIRRLICIALNLTVASWRSFKVEPASITVIENHYGKYVLSGATGSGGVVPK